MSNTVYGREILDSKLQKPFRLLVGGGSGSGKTTFVQKLVDSSHFATPFDKIVYCYPDYLDEIPIELDQIVEYRQGTCDLNYFSSLPKNSLVIYDDLMNECGNSNDVMKLFSVIARKRNLSIIFIVQNIFDNTKQFRNIRLNATGFVLFKFYAANDVTRRLLRTLSIQSHLPKHLLDQVYDKPFSYIYIDIHPQRQTDFIAIRGNIFDTFYSIYNKMEYVAIPKTEFLKHFKIVSAEQGTVKAIKDEIEIRKTHSRKRKQSRNPRKRKRVSSSDTQSSEYTDSTN